MDLEGEDRATDLLPAEDGMLIVTVHHLQDVDKKGVGEVKRALRMAEESGMRIVMLTSALPEEVQAWARLPLRRRHRHRDHDARQPRLHVCQGRHRH